MAVPETRVTRDWISHAVSGVILAGGKNSRMGGSDKAFLNVAGQSVFERTLDLLRRCFPQVVVVSNTPEKYRRFDVEVTADQFRGRGPLAGIHAALHVVRSPHVFVVACDMPFLRREPIEYLVRHSGDEDAVIPCWDGDIEPLHALYATRLRSRIERALGDGIGAIREFLPNIAVRYVPEAAMRTVAGADESFRNVNTPEDAARYAVEL